MKRLPLVLWLAACAEDKLVQEAGAPMSALELCALYLTGTINGDPALPFGRLCWEYATPVAVDDFVTGALEWTCRPGTEARSWADRLLGAAAAGRIAIDWTEARACVEQSRAARSSGPQRQLYTDRKGEWDAVKDGPCKRFLRSRLAPGDACVDDWDCPEGTGCYTDDRLAPESSRCLPPVPAGGECEAGLVFTPLGYAVSDWRPCERGSLCDFDTQRCEAAGAVGDPCTDPIECLSEYCDTARGECAAPPVLRQIGESCQSAEHCVQYEGCTVCRPRALGGPLTCQLMGGEGDYCRTWDDCATDLGCQAGRCHGSLEGEPCGAGAQGVCRAGLGCVPAADCGALDELGCQSQNACAWEASQLACVPTRGVCRVMPAIGPCLDGLCDARVSACVTVPDVCLPFALEGEACDARSSTAPPCAVGLSCVSRRCERGCERAADCAPDEWCDAGRCQSRPERCGNSSQCAPGSYCDACILLDGDRQGCEARADCGYFDLSSCLDDTSCFFYDLEVDCRSDPECTWTAGRCEALLRCSGRDEASCRASASCFWDAYALCDPIDAGATYSCAPARQVGERCSAAEQCRSGWCELEGDFGSELVCVVPPSGCDGVHEAAFAQLVFLFGLVLVRRRRD